MVRELSYEDVAVERKLGIARGTVEDALVALQLTGQVEQKGKRLRPTRSGYVDTSRVATETIEGAGVGGHSEAADVNGALSDEVGDFAGIDWQFHVSDMQAIFEVFVSTDTDGIARGHMVSKAPEGADVPDGQSWGVAVDLEDARQ